MKRRNFITASAIAAAAAGSMLKSEAAHASAQSTPGEMFDAENFALDEITITQLQDKFRKAEYSSEQVTKLYLDRITAIDKTGPALHSVIEVNPEAIAIAKKMDAERKAGKVRGPMHGIPVLIKDNIDTADKMQTTAGSIAMLGNIAAQDAFVVRKLREAGAVILGKTNS